MLSPIVELEPVPVPLRERPLLVHHVARLVSRSNSTVRYLASRGVLKGFKTPETPKIWRFWRRDIDEFLARKA
jgi:hypothetical protein